jgi:hypothetical protein
MERVSLQLGSLKRPEAATSASQAGVSSPTVDEELLLLLELLLLELLEVLLLLELLEEVLLLLELLLLELLEVLLELLEEVLLLLELLLLELLEELLLLELLEELLLDDGVKSAENKPLFAIRVGVFWSCSLAIMQIR